ncbi:MAG: LysR family transcriptional regulator [Pseudomonadota bacterium]
MELGWIDDFLALARHGNFSRAAEARNLTQPAFSRRIRALEDWVGVPLFDRGAAPVRPTEAGRRFLPAAEEVARQLALGRDDARAAARAAEGTLTVAATHALSLTFFPAWLSGLEARAAVGPVRLISDSMRACEEIMARGQAQFLLAHHHDAAPARLDPARHLSKDVGADALVPVAAAGVAGLGGDGRVPLLAYDEDSGTGRILAAGLAARGLAPEVETVFTSHLATVLR